MCGIIAYTGHRPAVPLLVEGLRRMEYRGYDSSGVAYIQGRELHVVRAEGKLARLEDKLAACPNAVAMTGIGHTRWATHGVPAERNAHPHASNDGSLALIHNGIIENYQELKDRLLAAGYVFRSETDTEALVNLIAEERKSRPDLLAAFAAALRQARGAYAVALISRDDPDVILAARIAAPLAVGVGAGEMFVASDMTAFLAYTRDVAFLDEGELVRLTASGFETFTIADLARGEKSIRRIQWDMRTAQKGGYKHFMIKEIFEQPKVIADCLGGRIAGDRVLLPELDDLPLPRRLHVVACGTSFHAGMWGRDLFERWADLPVSLDIASEFRYRRVALDPEDLVLVISQSGETADTLAALRLAKERGCRVVGLCNVVGSSIAREADAVIHTQAGPEISVASTKAMCSQMVALLLMALYYRQRARTDCDADFAEQTLAEQTLARQALAGLHDLSGRLERILPELRENARSLARLYSGARSFFFIGRGACYPIALEGALKLKEISYIHAEGYAAGEMKHGPIALIDPDFPTLAVALDDGLFPKTRSNIAEVQARRGKVIALVNPGCDLTVDHRWDVPEAWGPLGAFFALSALQLFSYEMADYLGKDVDQPRNLAKSVTVE
jgi:glucosamine--fructose-6-phosphate aminotransferase (isomerizing)